MGQGEGPKLDADAVHAGPAYDGPLDQDWSSFFVDIEQKIHMHTRDGSQGAFKPTAFAREIQCLTDSMKAILVDECAGKRRRESGILSDYHHGTLFCGLAAGWSYGLSTLKGCRMQM